MENPVSRRALLGSAMIGLPVLAASLTPSDPAAAAASPNLAGVYFNVMDYGSAVSTGYSVGSGGNDSVAFQAALTDAAATGGTVLCPAGTYRAEGLVVPAFVVLQGVGQNSRFADSTVNGGARAATRIIRPNGSSMSTTTMIQVTGAGAGLDNIQVEGGFAPGTILAMRSFESVLRWVRVIGSGGIGIDVERANNVKWIGIYVDNCGSTDLPAVRIWSKTGVGGSNETNNLDIVSLRIERSRNRALTIATGGTTDQEYAEWVKILFLHVENSYLDWPNTDPLIEIGNVRTVELVSPMLYGGPAPIIRHNQLMAQNSKLYGLGGVIVHGGTLLGSDTGITKNSRGETITPLPTPTLVDLVAGTQFKLIGTRLLRFSEQAVSAQPNYGEYSYSQVDVSTLAAFPNATVTGKPSVAGMNGATSAAILSRSSDTRGRIFFGSGAAVSAGVLVTITPYHPTGRPFIVTLMPKTGATVDLGIFAAVAADNLTWTIRARSAPVTNSAPTTYQVDYSIDYLD